MSKLRQITFLLFLSICSPTMADGRNGDSPKELKYTIINTSEAQYNLSDKHRNKPKFINFFELETTLATGRLWKNGSLHFNAWGVAQSMKERIADDDLAFSNLEANNAFNISQLGYAHSIGNFSVFGGIRNMSLDYFTSPYLLLFTNSCAGIYPTISMNYGVSNYPIAGMGVHAEYATKKFNFKNSFYNNLKQINEKDVFKFQFNPHKYGYTNITQASMQSSLGFYALGTALEKLPGAALEGSVFGIAEQQLFTINKTKIGAVAQFGYASNAESACRSYWGLGAIASGIFSKSEKDFLGVNLHNAKLADSHEMAIEITYQYAFSSAISINPAIHYMSFDSNNSMVGLLRATITFGN